MHCNFETLLTSKLLFFFRNGEKWVCFSFLIMLKDIFGQLCCKRAHSFMSFTGPVVCQLISAHIKVYVLYLVKEKKALYMPQLR